MLMCEQYLGDMALGVESEVRIVSSVSDTKEALITVSNHSDKFVHCDDLV